MEISRRCTRSSSALIRIFDSTKARGFTAPSFLLPAFTQQARPSEFSTTSRCESKIGSMPLSLPPDVTFNLINPSAAKRKANVRASVASVVQIEGPRGKIEYEIPSFVSIETNEQNRTRTLSIEDQQDSQQRAMWGMTRAYLQNHILGVSEGHAAILRLVGVGYRASIESSATTNSPQYPGQKFVSLKVGYSHPIELGIPEGVQASTPQPTRILLEGVNKEVVKQFAAEIRAWRKPEPYKGKGIFVNDEQIRLKAKKIK